MKPRLALQPSLPIFDSQEPKKKSSFEKDGDGGGGGTKPRGCASCSLNGKKKIFGEILGRDILVLAMCPGRTEEIKGIPLVGKAGQLLWKEAEKYGGFVREACDVDNVVRCHPTRPGYYGDSVDRDPTKEELHCCSLHTETQLAKAQPKVILILGEVARKQYIGGGRKQYIHRVFYDKERGCRVVCTFHPAYLLRGAPRSSWKEFRAALVEVKNSLAHPAERGYTEGNHYMVISNGTRATQVVDEYLKKNLVVIDVENGRREDGTPFLICCGVSAKPGTAHVFVTAEGETTSALRRLLLSDVAKSAWNGVSDIEKIEKLLETSVKNYRYDAMLSEYAAYPEAKDFHLESRVETRLKRFAGWKTPTTTGETNFALLPRKEVYLRCAVDCDVTYRLLATSLKKETRPLVRMLTDADFICHEMSERGIPFDKEYTARLMKYYDHWEGRYVEKIRLTAGNPNFNPTDDHLRDLLFNKLGLESSAKTASGKKDAVGKEALEKLLTQNSVVLDVLSLRYVRKAKSTYGVGFARSAEINGGNAKSRFKQTGTETGRMSSGGGKGKDSDRVNFQNIHGDPMVQNILVATPLWRNVVAAYENHSRGWARAFEDYPIFLKMDESQMEIRVLAIYSDDPLLVSQLSSGEDIHTRVGMEIFGWPREKAKEKIARTIIKQIHFGIIYGLQVSGIVTKLRRMKIKTSEVEIEEAHKRYFRQYSRVRDWIAYAHAFTFENGRALPSLFGLSREVRVDAHTPEQLDRDLKKGAHWVNVAVNTPVQGSAAEFLELAMALLKRRPDRYPLLRRTIVNNVHDALYWIARLLELRASFTQATQLMGDDISVAAKEEFNIKVNVPLVVEAEVGFRLGVSVDYNKEISSDQLLENWCAKNIEVESKFGRPPSRAVLERIGK